jgi:hypothetical protein
MKSFYLICAYPIIFHMAGVTVDAPRISDRGLTSIRLGVPECYIGAVLGRGGAVLKELIASTQCTIQVCLQE